MRVGINLLWVKPGKSGGIESYIRNLLDGFSNGEFKEINQFVLFVSLDNHETFETYIDDKKFIKVICNIKSSDVAKRIIWENLFLDKYAKKNELDCMFIPVYSKPLLHKGSCAYITVIHDLQALHYPEYFTKKKLLWLKFAWKRAAQTSNKIIAISKFVKGDIVDKLHINPSKIDVIYNPIKISNSHNDTVIGIDKYNIKNKEYFYAVSSMLPHKNLKTLIYLIKKIVDDDMDRLPKKLVLSGVGGSQERDLIELIKELGIERNVILTGFISNEERDSLYANAFAFLFPSLFEGFGMPVIEGLMQGIPVITTNVTSIPEVSKMQATYVEDPFSLEEWVEKIYIAMAKPPQEFSGENYSIETISKQYIDRFLEFKK
ncbi:glycosyltransferase family 4 protein [Bacillus sp. S14(2024)]|uniref:glycosyltransferase family 4 protein n=1 Tax=Bacillus sp. S14(2024) TaxID=3162884 RepID=UPI003D1B4C1C